MQKIKMTVQTRSIEKQGVKIFLEKKSGSKKPSPTSKVEEIVKIWNPRSHSAQTDVLGSYTGTSEFDDKRPIQDADDL